jgi:transposase-like protein
MVSVSSAETQCCGAGVIVEVTLEAGSSVARAAMKDGCIANQMFKRRRLHEAGRLGPRAGRGKSNYCGLG